VDVKKGQSKAKARCLAVSLVRKPILTVANVGTRPARHRGRDHEYKRYGTLSLLAGIDLLRGEVLGLVRDRHRSREFVEFLSLANQSYPAGARIRVVLDNHSAHISRETRAYLTSVPNRFEFEMVRRHSV
jgi:hypothetical protein